jgi:LTXXQ motif family protein
MAMMKAGLAGVATGALALATMMFIAPIAAQGPGAPPMTDRPGSPRGLEAPGLRGPGITGQDRGTMGRRAPDPSDPDITGPRGEAGICQERLTRMARFRLERIERLVRPTDAQRAAFEDLKTASAKALDIVRAACPIETPLTPTGRLELAEKRVEARLQAIKILRPPLEAFYRLLSDEQKVRWSLGTRADGYRGAWRERSERGPEAWDRRSQDRDETGRWRDDDRFRDGRGPGRDGFGRDGFGRDGYGPDPRRREQERWGERWRDMDRPEERWRDERRPGAPEQRL